MKLFDFRKEWELMGRTIDLAVNDSYDRSPNWCEYVYIELCISDIYSIDIISKSFLNGSFELFRTQEDAYKNQMLEFIEATDKHIPNAIKEITLHVNLLIESDGDMSFLEALEVDYNNPVFTKDYKSLFKKAFIGYSEQERREISERIEEHNKRNPESKKILDLLLMPGLSAVFSDYDKGTENDKAN